MNAKKINDLYIFCLEKCQAKFIEHKRQWSASFTLCGYDFQEYGDTEQSAKTNLATQLSQSKFIQNNIAKDHPQFAD